MTDAKRPAASGSGLVSIDLVLVSAKQLAELLSVSVRTIRRLDTSGVLPKPVQLGGSVRWPQREIAAWIAAGCPSRRVRNNDAGMLPAQRLGEQK
jgi:excisionase family DNA binding protein